MHTPISIIGAGLAGCEAAWQLAERGIPVRLHEMKPVRFSPAHQSPGLAELVCSNSLRGAALTNAVGLLKEELRRCAALFMQAADATAVPAGGALAVDRDEFSAYITEKITQHPRITLVREEVAHLPAEGRIIIAAGPLAAESISREIARLTGAEHLYFYDAIAPIVEADSIDTSKAWRASRYDKGSDDYLNCPLDEDQYRSFVAALRTADKVPARDFEQLIHFEGCMPIEELAARGDLTLAFGPMKPVGLRDPRTGREPFAVVQLRQDDRHASLYNLVGFQTKLTYPEQRRLFRTIPGLENARFARLGSMHRNTFINAPRCLNSRQQLRSDPHLFFAGQITGVEGYVESAASGFLAGLFAAAATLGTELPDPPATTALGALLTHLTQADPTDFQPMNVNYGLFPPLEKRLRKRAEKRLALAARALDDLKDWQSQVARVWTG
ncbi:methylenetetrahydrofolate--tRNA-(uracil(54)-C(5))-methyltransferase (FADH(2)-oxidizing) TrmFO [Geoalkalibacter halelectricus]|uniref:Methylenetetrahydrofolate--tRNA-(uracil-5-)-methyltransferase TrmFO n=1 Tax=Geoalkalibacter halelectricus TaxID=2847045 RepID=A0ABY5ZSY2_9BACT|nr:methylenetetrahydrofolate--tRNA-(uracil(54)-C(5))-methyltransferase (FADH(2)-oxidizing) TrmFO [Geoalkalibacter halelectricus]MDO3377462.1 methylenetetrahydrofolate--tRNA-(uracil(54)-C(5))-methyltransferase (FADH(2)-oxidizing) TrmFO [Geoalkalibacter halelectricus]UWZ80779.1 methylenetetrahydrofolate--tRNA-(uracil(54)-C(5))-methyltransferase (FADH(2)-oxidizing) TrmFO [Geoalkalibacter halelectricus]